MKLTKYLIGFLLVSFGIGLASCGQQVGSSISYSTGDEPWLGNWGNEYNSSEIPREHECETICYVCLKCLDYECTENVCASKCYELNGREKYIFNATDEKVKLESGKMGLLSKNEDDTGGYIGNFSLNKGCAITFVVEVPTTTVVGFGITLSQMSEDRNVTTACEVTINEEIFGSRAILKGDPTNGGWENFKESMLGCLTLREGKNTIRFYNHLDTITQFNIKNLILLSDEKIDLLNANTLSGETHVCEHQNNQGLCTDYDCNFADCLEKNETGWKKTNIYGGDEKVLKFSNNTDSLWIDGEQTIGFISNEDTKQTIIWAFEATEETYVRLSLEHSKNLPDTYFKDVWDLTLNNVEILTEGKVSPERGEGWLDFTFSTIAYVKVQKGTNIFKMVHKTLGGYNVRSLDLYYESGELSVVQALK